MLDLDLLTVASTALSYGEGPAVPWARIVLAFLLSIGVAVAAIAFMRWRAGQGGPNLPWLQIRRGAADAQRELELVERLVLSATTQLVVVRWRERKLLILVSPTGAEVLSEDGAAVTPGTEE